jgi:hypothetical protein
MVKVKNAPATNVAAQAAVAAGTAAPTARFAIVSTGQYSVAGSKRGLTGGNQPRYGSNNAATLSALQAAQGNNASISGALVLSTLKALKHTDFAGYAYRNGWLVVVPATLAAGPL